MTRVLSLMLYPTQETVFQSLQACVQLHIQPSNVLQLESDPSYEIRYYEF